MQINESMINAFARLTGDFNSLHMDEEIARKSRFRTRIVHGMLPFSMLALLHREFSNKVVQFSSFRTRFFKPIHYDQNIVIEVQYSAKEVGNEQNKKFEFVSTISALPHLEKLTEIKGDFYVEENIAFNVLQKASKKISLLNEELKEELNTLESLKLESTEHFPFIVDKQSLSYFSDEILNVGTQTDDLIALPSTNLVASLLLSTVVGMKIPGRYATFSSFKLEFLADVPVGKKCILNTNIVKISKATEVIKTEIAIECNGEKIAQGRIESLVNPPPVQMLTCEQINRKGLSDLGLKGKIALVTGSSRGIGETTAKLLAMLGCKVVITYYKGKDDAQKIAADIHANGGTAIVRQCDVTNEESVSALFDAISELGEIDILVNNAVKEFSSSDLESLNWEDFLGELQVTLKGAHLCCKHAISVFKNKKAGKIINLSTIAVSNPPTGQAKYISAKSALEGYTKSLAKDLVKYNIQSNVVVPNMAETDLVSSIPTAYRAKIAQSRPYGRHIKPIEVAQSIAFLASSWSDAITGQKIVLNLGEPPYT